MTALFEVPLYKNTLSCRSAKRCSWTFFPKLHQPLVALLKPLVFYCRHPGIHPTSYLLRWAISGWIRKMDPKNPCKSPFWGVWTTKLSGCGCFLKWWYPQNTPKWSFFCRKTNGCWVPTFYLKDVRGFGYLFTPLKNGRSPGWHPASPQLRITEFGCRKGTCSWTSIIGRRLEDHYLVNTRFLSKVPQVNGWRTMMTHHWRGVLGHAFDVKVSHFATEIYTENSFFGIFRKFDFRIWHRNSISNLTG